MILSLSCGRTWGASLQIDASMAIFTQPPSLRINSDLLFTAAESVVKRDNVGDLIVAALHFGLLCSQQ